MDAVLSLGQEGEEEKTRESESSSKTENSSFARRTVVAFEAKFRGLVESSGLISVMLFAS